MRNTDTEKPKPVWCIVANVVYERPYGPGGEETRSGTKHFAPGAKVHLVDFFWGEGGEKITVVGRHRESHKYMNMVIRSEWLTNWRVELVYSPRVIQEVVSYGRYKPDHVGLFPVEEEKNWASSAAAKAKAEQIIGIINQHHEATRRVQPPLTRPPYPPQNN